jgi:hypothetical protein
MLPHAHAHTIHQHNFSPCDPQKRTYSAHDACNSRPLKCAACVRLCSGAAASPPVLRCVILRCIHIAQRSWRALCDNCQGTLLSGTTRQPGATSRALSAARATTAHGKRNLCANFVSKQCVAQQRRPARKLQSPNDFIRCCTHTRPRLLVVLRGSGRPCCYRAGRRRRRWRQGQFGDCAVGASTLRRHGNATPAPQARRLRP